MIEMDIADFGPLRLEHLVMDYNGTLAVDGLFIPGVKERLRRLAGKLNLHIITADTFGKVKEQAAGLPLKVLIAKSVDQAVEKLRYIQALDSEKTVAVGNGRNDALMLKSARLGIACIQREGAAVQTILQADVLVKEINDALDLLLNPLRLKATLRG